MATLYENFAFGTILDEPLLFNSTIVNSMGFASLPIVQDPDIMWVVLDPTGIDGSPEIIKVVDHALNETKLTCIRARQNTVGREHKVNTNWIVSFTKDDLGDVYQTVDDISATVDAVYDSVAAVLAQTLVPAGTVIATIGTTADIGYLMLDGSAVVGGKNTYPYLWNRIPDTWKYNGGTPDTNGPDIHLPDARGKTLFSKDSGSVFTLGNLSGANSKTLTGAHIPAHKHDIQHGHADTLGFNAHSIDHVHGGSSLTASSGGVDHYHAVSLNTQIVHNLAGGFRVQNVAEPNGYYYNPIDPATTTGWSSAYLHTHPVSGNTGSMSAAGYGTSLSHTKTGAVTNLPAGNYSQNGNQTDGTALTATTSLDVTPANLCINWQIKAH